MARRFPSPDDEDISRIAETIDSLDLKKEIRDRDTFDSEYEAYLEDSPELLKNVDVRNKVFESLRQKHPSRITDESIFRKAKGKSLEQDRRQTAQVVVTDKKEYQRLGARRVDLEGYDTKRVKKDIVGRSKGKIVYTSRETVMVKGKPMIRHRDRLGRFASIK